MSSDALSPAFKPKKDMILQLQLTQAASEGNLELVNNTIKLYRNSINSSLLNLALQMAIKNNRLNTANALITAFPNEVDEKIVRQAVILALKRGSNDYYTNWITLVPLEPISSMQAKRPNPLKTVGLPTPTPRPRSSRRYFSPLQPLDNNIMGMQQPGLSTSI